MEHLSDASFLGKLLVLPANVRLDWKVIARYKHFSLLGLVVSNKGKKFYNVDTCSPTEAMYSPSWWTVAFLMTMECFRPLLLNS